MYLERKCGVRMHKRNARSVFPHSRRNTTDRDSEMQPRRRARDASFPRQQRVCEVRTGFKIDTKPPALSVNKVHGAHRCLQTLRSPFTRLPDPNMVRLFTIISTMINLHTAPATSRDGSSGSFRVPRRRYRASAAASAPNIAPLLPRTTCTSDNPVT